MDQADPATRVSLSSRIADFAADLRAPTPSAAAELVTSTRGQLLERIEAAQVRLEKEARYRLAQAARRLHECGTERAASALQRSLGRRLQRIDEIDFRLRGLDPRLRLAAARRRLEAGEAALGGRVRFRLLRERARLDAASTPSEPRP